MDQQEWAVSEDPLAILAAVGETLGDHPDRSFYRQAPVEASERKLRLFACACARAVWDKLGEPRTRLAVEVAERVADGLLGSVDRGKAFNAAENIPSPTQGYVAEACLRADAAEGAADIVGAIREWLPTMPSILHDLFGNPFAPVTLPPGPPVRCHICYGHGGEMVATYGPPRTKTCCGRPTVARRDVGNCRGGHYPEWCQVCWAGFLPEHTGYRIDKPCTCCKGKKVLPGPCPWITPQVLRLAEAAYQDRPGRKCVRCKGTGLVRNFIARGAGDNATTYWDDPCPDCNPLRSGIAGTGRVEGGTLDPLTLCAVADALEEVGCPSSVRVAPDEEKGRRLRAAGRRVLCERGCCFECAACSARPGSPVLCGPCLEMRAVCARTPASVPHPLLAHLRSEGPHWRGCWVIDLLTGRV
jgi:hypothetical protein